MGQMRRGRPSISLWIWVSPFLSFSSIPSLSSSLSLGIRPLCLFSQWNTVATWRLPAARFEFTTTFHSTWLAPIVALFHFCLCILSAAFLFSSFFLSSCSVSGKPESGFKNCLNTQQIISVLHFKFMSSLHFPFSLSFCSFHILYILAQQCSC